MISEGSCDTEDWNNGEWDRLDLVSPKRISLKKLFSRCSVDCEAGGIWKLWRKFSHVVHVVAIDIHVYQYCAC